MKTILITGGAGFIGSTLADALLAQGMRVVCVDNFDPFYNRSIKEANISKALQHSEYTLVEADIRDSEKMRHCMEKYLPDTVVHLAAKVGVRPSIQNAEEYYSVNVMGTLTLLNAMQQIGINRMVLASSSSIYGNSHSTPFSEKDTVDHPISPYAATKKAAELLAHTYHHLHGFDIFCLRFFTVYGPRQRPDLAINKFTDLILKEEPIPVFGDGSSARDYTYVADIVSGIRAAIEQLKGYDIINLGESQVITLSELIGTLETLIGKKAIINRKEKQPGDVDVTFADISKAKELLGYRPKFSKEEGLDAFVRWKKSLI